MQEARAFSLDHEARKVKALERIYQKNLAAREKHADDPREFLDSEIALDDAINEFGQLSTNPTEIKLFVDQHGFEILASIVESHANPDVAQSAINVVGEIVDPENFNLEENNICLDIAKHLIVELKWFALMSAHLEKFSNLDEETDHEAVASTLQCISHAMGLAMTISVPSMLGEDALVNYLFDRTRVFDDIALQACDILADISAFLLANSANVDSSRALTKLGQERLATVLDVVQDEIKSASFTSALSEEVILTLLDCVVHYVSNDASLLSDPQIFPIMIKCYQSAQKELHASALKLLPIILKQHKAHCNEFVEKNNLRRLFNDLAEATAALKNDLLLSNILILHSLIFECSNEPLGRIIAKLVANGMSEFADLMGIMQTLTMKIQESEGEFIKEMEADMSQSSRCQDWLTAPTSRDLLSIEKLALESTLYEMSEDELIIAGLICQIVLRLNSLGDKKLKLGIHLHMSENPDIFSTFKRNCNRLKCLSPERITVEGQTFEEFIESHNSVLTEANKMLADLREKATKASTDALEQEQARRTERNRETRQKHKIRRMDAEMKRLQGIEDARYARKNQSR